VGRLNKNPVSDNVNDISIVVQFLCWNVIWIMWVFTWLPCNNTSVTADQYFSLITLIIWQ